MFFGKNKKLVVNTDPEKIEEFLTRGVESIFPNKEFLKSKLEKGERLTFYLGIDPTGPTLHLGHVIPLRKLGKLQELGHNIILLMGDFTAMIGDPTDKTATRKKLTHTEVLANLIEYKKQASKYISFDGNNPAQVKFNSEWLGKMNFADVLDLASQMTVQQMLARDMFEKRMADGAPIYIHEFMYPLMQGYDSVAMNVDGEIGGNDQTWNMLAGRDLVKSIQAREKFVIAMKLLTDSTGKKMGKTENNMVALNQTADKMFGRVMSWSDGLIVPGFELVTDVSVAEIASIQKDIDDGANPRDAKVRLAKEIVRVYHGASEAEKAFQGFEKTFVKGGIPDDIETISAGQEELLMDVLVAKGIVESKTDFRRLVGESAVTNMDTDEKVKESNAKVVAGTYKIGKRRFVKIEINK